MTKRAAVYARVSTNGQTTDNQVDELRAVADRAGWDIVAEFIDAGVSGTRESRPEFDRLMKAAVHREFDVVMAWSVDRLGRSLKHLVTLLDELHTVNVDLYLHQQGLDTTTPAGKALFQMSGVFAEFERAMLVERTKAGLVRARAQGKRLGRPPIKLSVERKIRRLRQQGMGKRKIAKTLGTGVGTVSRVVAGLELVPKQASE